jgi:pimeloyl-ACP methyl ester carboxylesterase
MARGLLALALLKSDHRAMRDHTDFTTPQALDEADMNEPSLGHYLTVSGGRLAYDDTGGPEVLVIATPSMGDLRGEYRQVAPILARSGYRVVTLDVRGQGQSSAPWNDYSAHATGRDVLTLIEHPGADPAVLIGTSFTAGSALWARTTPPPKSEAS